MNSRHALQFLILALGVLIAGALPISWYCAVLALWIGWVARRTPLTRIGINPGHFIAFGLVLHEITTQNQLWLATTVTVFALIVRFLLSKLSSAVASFQHAVAALAGCLVLIWLTNQWSQTAVWSICLMTCFLGARLALRSDVVSRYA
jgi:hypothetical protein